MGEGQLAFMRLAFHTRPSCHILADQRRRHGGPLLIGMPDEIAIVGPTDRERERYGMSRKGIVAACRALTA